MLEFEVVFYCGYLSTLLWIYRHFSANACLAPLCAMHGLAVTTVEGIGSVKNGLHPVQVRQTFWIYTCIVISLSIHPSLQNYFYGAYFLIFILKVKVIVKLSATSLSKSYVFPLLNLAHISLRVLLIKGVQWPWTKFMKTFKWPIDQSVGPYVDFVTNQCLKNPLLDWLHIKYTGNPLILKLKD